ncbi:hypothetical protein niasHT_036844 [Heterodera trifolii]|uniref:Lon proteolytic domain-containing protein n=1 Tax=Heterodera trifolii TaxID=157864 RepID=A0ABD2I465_9BILA
MMPNANAIVAPQYFCNRTNCGASSPTIAVLRSHIFNVHGNDNDHWDNRKPNSPGQVLGVYSTPPLGAIPAGGRTVLFTVRVCRRRVRARPLTISFPCSEGTRMAYSYGIEQARQMLGVHQLPNLRIRRWPPVLSTDGPSGGAAIFCAVYSLFTGRLCRADSAVTAAVDAFAPMVIGVGDLDLKAEGAVAAGLARLVMAQENAADWAALPAVLTEQLEGVFVNNLDQMVEAMFLPV